SDFDYRFSAPASADQQVFVPLAFAGTWYALVYGDTIRTSSDYHLTPTTGTIQLSTVTPSKYGANSSMTMVATGGGFDASTQIALVSGNNSYVAQTVTIDSFSQLTATFNLSAVPQGAYSVRVSKSGALDATLANAFTVLPPGAPKFETHLT